MPIIQPDIRPVTGTVRNHPKYIHPTSRKLIHLQSPLASPTPTVAPAIHCVWFSVISDIIV